MKIRSLLGCIFLLLSISFQASAGIPPWTFTPLTPTTVSLDNSRTTAFVVYRVTNRSLRSHSLVFSPFRGVTQVVGGRFACSATNTISFGQSCNLVLKINAANISSSHIFGGPVLCESGNPLECYQPSSANSLNITVNNTQLFSIGGTVTALTGTVVLQKGTELLPISADGPFTFATLQAPGTPYLVTIQTQPAGQTCTVINRAGIVGTANVTNIRVICNSQAYTVGGTINGLTGTVVLQNNGDTVSVTAPTNTFTFPAQANGSPYSVTVQTQPAGQICSVANGTGIVSGADVTNVIVTCSTQTYTIGGTVTGLAPGGTVVLSNFGASFLPVSANGGFVFPEAFADGSPYSVTVASNPTGQLCQVTNGVGVITGANVTNILVTCTSGGTSNISSSPRIIIPINGVGTITVQTFNTAFPAINVHAVLPSEWTDVTQDATDCAVLPPFSSCTLTFTSGGQPYVAQAVQIVGDNVQQPATTAIAFSIDGFLVYGVDSPTSATVMNIVGATGQWISPPNTLTGALSLTDGFTNTAIIVPQGNFNTASFCFNSTAGGAPVGTWFLPAICQLGPVNQAASCPPGIANIQQNLGIFGYFNFNSPTTAWSSTEYALNPQSEVWVQGIVPASFGDSSQFTEAKVIGSSNDVMCSRSIPY